MSLTTSCYFHYQNSSPNSFISLPDLCNNFTGLLASTYACLKVHLHNRNKVSPLKCKSDHISPLFKWHQCLPITHVIKTSALNVVYKTLHNLLPPYIFDVIYSLPCSVYSSQTGFPTTFQTNKVCSCLTVLVLEKLFF